MEAGAAEVLLAEPDESAVKQPMKKQRLLPKKADFRQRAHCNPLSDSFLIYPPSPDFVDWSLHFPQIFGRPEITTTQWNSMDNPILYPHRVADAVNGRNAAAGHRVEILDVGCGYGGLMVELAQMYKTRLIMGMEIREKVAAYVGNKINALRQDTAQSHSFNNVAVLRTNVMKFLVNYIRKAQLLKMFICFPDPHFKRSNARRRIVGPAMLTLYAYVLAPGGMLYTVTDVYDLHIWMLESQRSHPLFEELEVTESLRCSDPCVALMETQTEEGKKVIRGNKPCYSTVFRRISNPS